jgi:hypothetical protein
MTGDVGRPLGPPSEPTSGGGTPETNPRIVANRGLDSHNFHPDGITET